MSKPTITVWFLFLVLFLLASIFPPWESSFLRERAELKELRFSLFFKPPIFYDDSTSISVNDVIYSRRYTGDVAWRFLFFEYFIIVVSCISLWMIEDKFQKTLSSLFRTKTQKIIKAVMFISIMVISIIIAVFAVQKFYLQPKRYAKLYDDLKKAGYFENTAQSTTNPNDLLSGLISACFGSTTSKSGEVGYKLMMAQNFGYSANEILAAFCKAYPADADFCPEYKNVKTTLTLDEMATVRKSDLRSQVQLPVENTDPNKSKLHLTPISSK
jgi:hypothetical protein